jgi:nicotinamide mononucleotide adenylyltransferase
MINRIQTMSTPGVWSEDDLEHILGRYGTFIVERTGTDIDDAIANLQPWKDNIYVIQQLIQVRVLPSLSRASTNGIRMM